MTGRHESIAERSAHRLLTELYRRAQLEAWGLPVDGGYPRHPMAIEQDVMGLIRGLEEQADERA